MEEYLHNSRLGEAMDALGFSLAVLAGCVGWFVALWGLRLPALTAGAALYILVLLIRRKSRDGRLMRREKRLRARIGGEMALERLLTAQPDRAHFEMAMLLSMRYPLALLRSGEEGVVCSFKGELLLVSFFQMPAGSQISAENVLRLQRETRRQRAQRGVLCAPCAISAEARRQAAGEIPVTFLSRDTLISLFGGANPATDAQLVALGRRRRAQKPKGWLRWVLDPRRAARYGFYGLLLLGMYLFTRLLYYALFGLLCVGLAAASRCTRREKESL